MCFVTSATLIAYYKLTFATSQAKVVPNVNTVNSKQMGGLIIVFYDEYCRLCNSVGKSPSACAEVIGFKRSVVTRWKNGMIPRDANMMRIADYFGVSVDELQGIKKEPVEDKLSDAQKMLMSMIPNLSDDTASMLLILAKQLTVRNKSQDGE